MPLVAKQTPRGQVMVGDLPADFLRVPHIPHPQSLTQVQTDEMAARMLQARQPGGFGGFQQPTNVTGRLSVSIAQAKLTKNYGITRMDPYCRLRVGHAVFETPTASSAGKNPHWSKTVQCYLPLGVDTAYIEIFDEKTFQGDNRVAWAHLPIPETTMSGETVDDWYPLNGKLGDGKEGMINIIFSFTPIEPAPQATQPPVQLPAPQVTMIPGAPGMYYPAYPTPVQPVPAGYYPPQPQGIPQQANPARPPVPVAMSEDDLNQIKDMFPDVEMEVIKSVADSQRGNKDSTINALLSMQS